MTRRLASSIRALVVGMALVAGPSVLTAQSAPDAVGMWQIAEKDVWVRIERLPDATLLGRIAWMAEPNDSSGRPKTDINNPDKAQRTHPVLGSVILRGFKADVPSQWKDGVIYDGRNGKTYRAGITLAGTDTLKLRGYVKIGFLKMGRTSAWTRVRPIVAPDSGSALILH